MFIDARELSDGHGVDSEVCIIGGGAAGITIARELLHAELRVCVLEGGGLEYSETGQANYAGKNIGLPYPDLDVTRLRYFGGSTNHWGGWCAPLNAIDFEPRSWVPYSGRPITKTDLDPFYKRAQSVCQLGPYYYGDRIWQRLGKSRPHFARDKLISRFWQHSAPTRFGQVYRDDLNTEKSVHVLLNANVTSLNVGSDSNSLKFADFITQEGKRGRVRARQFVLASGGIENPRLLLLSNSIEPRGLGNRHDLVGRFFMEHPHIPCARVAANDSAALIGMYDPHRLDGLVVHAGLCPSEIIQEEQKVLNGSVTVETVEHPDPSVRNAQALWRGLKAREFPNDFDEKVWSVISGIDTVAATTWKRFAENERVRGYIQLYARMEQAPNPESRIQLSKERDALGLHRVELDWRLTSVTYGQSMSSRVRLRLNSADSVTAV